jgi:hypothetical protein
MEFPEAVIIANKIYFWEDEVFAWIENHRASKQEPPTGPKHIENLRASKQAASEGSTTPEAA